MANEQPQTLSDLIAERVRKLRKEQNLTAAELAGRCATAGMPEITAQVIYKLEKPTGRTPRSVSVDELAALAAALQVRVSALAPELLGIKPSDGTVDDVVAAVKELKNTLEKIPGARVTLEIGSES